MDLIKPGVYRHFKGQLYLVVGSTRDCVSQKEYVNSIPMFGNDFTVNSQPRERFEQTIDLVRFPDGSLISARAYNETYTPDVNRSVEFLTNQPRFQHVLVSKDASTRTPFAPIHEARLTLKRST